MKISAIVNRKSAIKNHLAFYFPLTNPYPYPAMKHLLIALCLWTGINVYSSGQPQLGNTGGIIPGTSQPKAVKDKIPKIKYAVHEGTAHLKTGLVVTGKFIYTELKGEVPQYNFVESTGGGRKTVALSMIDRLVLAGVEKGVNSRIDSTEFVWIEKFKDLYRKIRTGNIELYDNSRIVDEPYEFLSNYLMIAGRKGYDYKIVKQVADLAPLMDDRPYFMESLRATGRQDSKDLRIALYLINLFNDPQPMGVLAWDTLQLTLKDGSTLVGRGYTQPLDLRNEHLTNANAYIHFFDGRELKLYTQNEVASISTQGKTYIRGMYAISGKHFFGQPWENNGNAYLVTRRILTSSNYYFKYRQPDRIDITILQADAGGNYIKPINEAQLRQIYLSENQP